MAWPGAMSANDPNFAARQNTVIVECGAGSYARPDEAGRDGAVDRSGDANGR